MRVGLTRHAAVVGATSSGVSDHVTTIFVVVIVVAAVLLVAGIVGLVLTRDGRRRGRHH